MNFKHGCAAVLGTALACAAFTAGAQRTARVPHVAFLGMDSRMQAANVAGFVEGMRALGYEDGKNVVFDYHWAEGRFDLLPALADEVVARKPDVIVTAAPPPVRAAQKATSTIPIVMMVHDPVGQGFAASLARPGGNITGVAFQDTELSTKRLDILSQLVPNLSRVAVIWNMEGGGDATWRALEVAARPSGIEFLKLEVRQPEDLAAAVASAKAWKADGIVQLASPFITKHRAVLLDAVARNRLPVMCEMRMYVAEGCLTTYSASYPGMFRLLSVYVDRILRGAKPSDLPIEQPREFEFVINQKTAQSLGIAIPQSLLLQTTEVIR